MNLLGESRLQSLQGKSESIFGMFTKALNKLNKVNAAIEEEQQKLRTEIQQKENEHGTLEEIKIKNLRFSDKLTKLIS